MNENTYQPKYITSEHFSNMVRKTANEDSHKYNKGVNMELKASDIQKHRMQVFVFSMKGISNPGGRS